MFINQYSNDLATFPLSYSMVWVFWDEGILMMKITNSTLDVCMTRMGRVPLQRMEAPIWISLHGGMLRVCVCVLADLWAHKAHSIGIYRDRGSV